MRRHPTLALIFALVLALGCTTACSDDTRNDPWGIDESDAATDADADAEPDSSQDVSADADAGDSDVPTVEPPGCAEDNDQSYVVAADPALLQGYWSKGEAIGNCIHAVSWLHFGQEDHYEQVHVDGNYCYEEGRGVHACTGAWRIEESAGTLAEICELESQPETEQSDVSTAVSGTYAVHKEAGGAARLTRMAFRRSPEREDGQRREWVRLYTETRQFGNGSTQDIQIEARLAIEESALTGAADSVEQTSVVLDLDVSLTREDSNGDVTTGWETFSREFEASVEPLEGGLRRLTVDLGFADSPESERWRNYLASQPDFQAASALGKRALVEAFHSVIYFDAADPRIGAGHAYRQTWRAICDPCESYAANFPDQMAEMCD